MQGKQAPFPLDYSSGPPKRRCFIITRFPGLSLFWESTLGRLFPRLEGIDRLREEIKDNVCVKITVEVVKLYP